MSSGKGPKGACIGTKDFEVEGEDGRGGAHVDVV